MRALLHVLVPITDTKDLDHFVSELQSNLESCGIAVEVNDLGLSEAKVQTQVIQRHSDSDHSDALKRIADASRNESVVIEKQKREDLLIPKQRMQAGFLRFLQYLRERRLEEMVCEVALGHNVTVAEMYFDRRGPAVMSARVEVWWHLAARFGRTSNQIAEMMDRNGPSIRYALRALEQLADELSRDVEESTVRQLTKELAQRVTTTGKLRKRANIEASRAGGKARAAQASFSQIAGGGENWRNRGVAGGGHEGNDIVAEKTKEYK